ncbi:MAG: hypothetical protein PVF45_06670 [Anaerolineae bacterium]
MRRLEEAARLLQGDHEPRQVAGLLAPVNAWLREQSQPPCTCGEQRGTARSGYSTCLRHPHLSACHVSTAPALERFYTGTTRTTMTTGERRGAE